MNELLRARYAALFNAYGVGANEATRHVKNRILEMISMNPDFLRVDAAFFLLTSIDQMVIIPYTSEIIKDSPTQSVVLSAYQSYTETQSMIDRYLRIIFDDVSKLEERPVSAHGIVRAINRRADDIDSVLSWALPA